MANSGVFFIQPGEGTWEERKVGELDLLAGRQ